MKKLCLLLFFGFFSCYFFGQAPTYTMKFTYQAQNLNGCTSNLCSGCQRKDKFWKIGNYVAPYNQNGFANILAQGTYSSNLNITESTISIFENNMDIFYFTNYSENCYMPSNQPVNCYITETIGAISQTQLYESAVAPITAANTCMGIIKVLSYKPNMILNIPTKYNVTYSNEEYQQHFQFGVPLPERGATVCSGELINLSASPPNFKLTTYNWQYKLKNTGWKNFRNTPYKPNPIFIIADILNTEDINYTGFIDIRLGSGQNAPFTSSVKLNYSPCGPTISNVNFEGPVCNGEIVKSLSVTFNEQLNSAIGEQLASISVVDIDNESKIFMQAHGPISYPENTKKYTYSSFQQLQTGHTYKIKYQAQIPDPNDSGKTIMRGVLYSPAEFNFLYTEPDPLKFKIIRADNPKCKDDFTEVSLTVTGGTGNYKFYVDGVEKTNPKPVKEVDGYYYIKGLVPTAVNNIKVVDQNNCFEKNL